MRLAVRDLSAQLAGRSVVRRVGFEVEAPHVLGLIGPNGAGKTTLLRSLAGLLPSQGEVNWGGRNLRSLPVHERAKTLAYLSQSADAHWPLEVERVVALGRLPHLGAFARPRAEDEAAVERALERVDAENFKGRRVDQLSGGERARVLLARALAVEAPALLVDEPVTSLDPYHQLKVMEVLSDYAAEGRLVVVVLHDLTLAARFCDSLMMLSEGHVHAFGPPETVLSEKNIAEVYRVSVATGEHVDGAGRNRFVLPWARL